MAAAVQALDEIIKEYLLFRGFANTLKTFEAELKIDKDKSFRVNRIVEQFMNYVQYYDLQGIREYWTYLKRRFFSRLDSMHLHNAHKLERCLYRFYLVNAVQASRMDKVTEFFEKMSAELQNHADWKEWFALPFLKNPEQNPTLEMYFSSLWKETFPLSLHNFLNAIFQNKLKQDNKQLQRKVATLQLQINSLQENKLINVTDVENQQSINSTKTTEKYAMSIPKTPPTKNKENQEKHKSLPLPKDFEILPSTDRNMKLDVEMKTFDMPPQNIKFDRGNTSKSSDLNMIHRGNDFEKDVEKKPEILNDDDFENIHKDMQSSNAENLQKLVVKETRSLSFSTKNSPRYTPGLRRAKSTVSKPQKQEMKIAGSHFENTEVTEERETPSFIILGEEKFSEHNSAIVQCDFSPNGQLVSSLDTDGIVKIWKHQPIISTVATVMLKTSILSAEWASKSDKVLLMGTSNGKIRFYDTETKITRCELSTDSQNSRIVALACNPSGTSFVCSTNNGMVKSASLGRMPSFSKNLSSMEPDKSALSTNNVNRGALFLWDLKTLKFDRNLPINGFQTRINCIAYNHNGTLLITGGADGIIRIYDTRKYDCLMSWPAHDGPVFSVQFSVDETSAFTLGKDDQLFQWSLRKMGPKTAILSPHVGISGPRDYYKPVTSTSMVEPAVFSRLFSFNSTGDHLLTCAPSSAIIYEHDKSNSKLSRPFSIGKSKSHVTSVDWNTTGDCITCTTGCVSGQVCLTTLLRDKR